MNIGVADLARSLATPAKCAGRQVEVPSKCPRERLVAVESARQGDCQYLVLVQKQPQCRPFEPQPRDVAFHGFADQARELAFEMEWRQPGLLGQPGERQLGIEVGLQVSQHSRKLFGVHAASRATDLAAKSNAANLIA